jgi:hypothetical protein
MDISWRRRWRSRTPPSTRLSSVSRRLITKLVVLPHPLSRLRLYSDAELAGMIRAAGFHDVDVRGWRPGPGRPCVGSRVKAHADRVDSLAHC